MPIDRVSSEMLDFQPDFPPTRYVLNPTPLFRELGYVCVFFAFFTQEKENVGIQMHVTVQSPCAVTIPRKLEPGARKSQPQA